MYTRRRLVAIGAVGIGALSGCAELATGDGPITREASPAELDSSVTDETGHQLDDQREEVVSREVSAAGQTREIEATNHVSIYTESTEGSDGEAVPTSVFVLATTPAFSVAGQTLNPIADYSNEELLEFATGELGNLTVGDVAGETTETVLGTETTVTTFDAEGEFGGERADIYVHVTSVEHEGDIVVAVGGYPQGFDEEADITRLFGAIQHPAE